MDYNKLREEAKTKAQSLLVFCKNIECGEPIILHFGNGPLLRTRRRMENLGMKPMNDGRWECFFACPVCGETRKFILHVYPADETYHIVELTT